MMKIQLDDLSSIFRTFSHGEPNDKPIIICGWFMLYNGDDLGMVYGIGKSWGNLNGQEGLTPVVAAVEGFQAEAVKLLCERRADVEICTEKGALAICRIIVYVDIRSIVIPKKDRKANHHQIHRCINDICHTYTCQ